MKYVLSIAGSDPSGGAGIQADLKVFTRIGVQGMAVITALTAQSPERVYGIYDVSAEFVRDQLVAVFDDCAVDAVKIGMLARADVVEAVADVLQAYRPAHVVLDPVMVASSGDALIDGDAIEVMKARLMPLASIITPNIPEAEKLSRKAVLDMEQAARGLVDIGAQAVLLKGGHLKGDVMRDVLAHSGGVRIYEAPRVDVESAHGTGCRLSSAIAAYLALGHDLEVACGKAKDYLTQDLKTSL